jgi:hypothetical protein
MGRMLFAPAILAAALKLLAQTPAPAPDQATEKSPPPCMVSGRVVTATEGSPLKLARVALIPETEGRQWQVYAAHRQRWPLCH